jgi:oxysterol-binding protein-related protein 3/6/7
MSLATTLPGPPIVHEGWVLKKRRKKMQGLLPHRLRLFVLILVSATIGFAKRYFTLFNTGILSYAFGKGQPVRDQITLHDAVISTTPGQLDIHVDSNISTYHIKCLTTADFDAWMVAFRSLLSPSSTRLLCFLNHS